MIFEFTELVIELYDTQTLNLLNSGNFFPLKLTSLWNSTLAWI